MITEAKLDEVRERWNALEARKTRAYVKQNGSYLGSTRGAQVPGGPFRFVHFCYAIERSQRVANSFAVHAMRVEHALRTSELQAA